MGTRPRRAPARSDAPRDGLAAADHRDRVHRRMRSLGRGSRACSQHSGASWSRARQPPVPHEPGHLRHRGRRRRNLRLPLRAVRRAGHRASAWASSSSTSRRRSPAVTPADRRRCRVFASAMFGMLSGSSVANAVTVGSLTIPAMIRLGYPRHFAGGVEAASSTGGQITPPIMGAAAFLMIEFLNVPYSDHHHRRDRAGVHALLRRVHAGALRGQAQGPARPHRRRSCRICAQTLAANWPTLIPLRPADRHHRQRQHAVPRRVHRHQLCIARRPLHHRASARRHAYVALLASHAVAARASSRGSSASYELVRVPRDAGGRAARASCAGRTVAHRRRADPGRSFRDRRQVRAGRRRRGGDGRHRDRRGHADRRRLQAVVHHHRRGAVDRVGGARRCCRTAWPTRSADAGRGARHDRRSCASCMGCGIPTTANYIIMVTVAAPTLVLLGVQPIVAHFFVFYYGVLADITPPVALAAYAARRHGRSRSVQDRQHGVSARPRQGAGAVRVRVRAFAAAHGAEFLVVRIRASRSSAACSASRCSQRRCRTSCSRA